MRKYTNNRALRIADQIHKDVMTILRTKVKHPKVKWVTVNDVEVDKEFAYAKIYWSVLDDKEIPLVTKALNSASGFIRTELSKGFKTYTIPQLKFIYDDALQRGLKVLTAIDSVCEIKQNINSDDIDDIKDNAQSTSHGGDE